jgi:hypothetical protein
MIMFSAEHYNEAQVKDKNYEEGMTALFFQSFCSSDDFKNFTCN